MRFYFHEDAETEFDKAVEYYSNLRKHGVSFEEAATVFIDPWRSPTPIQTTPIGRKERSRSAIPRNDGSCLYPTAKEQGVRES